MLSKITPDIHKKLEEIGFGEDEINMIQIVHELKSRSYSIDIQELIRKAAFENLAEGVSRRFEESGWDEEDFFQMVEDYRADRKK